MLKQLKEIAEKIEKAENERSQSKLGSKAWCELGVLISGYKECLTKIAEGMIELDKNLARQQEGADKMRENDPTEKKNQLGFQAGIVAGFAFARQTICPGNTEEQLQELLKEGGSDG